LVVKLGVLGLVDEICSGNWVFHFADILVGLIHTLLS